MKYSGIGGQAVIEGVMMRNGKQCAVAVRKPDGEIEVKKETVTSLRDRYAIARVPVIRGIVSFVESLSSGMKTLNYSASFYEEEEEKQEKTEEEKKKQEKKDSILTGIVMVVSVFLALAVFLALPYLVSELLRYRIPSPQLRGLLEGVIRVILFVAYVKLISLMEDIHRVFMYHGAEHKCINCIENGMDLTVENGAVTKVKVDMGAPSVAAEDIPVVGLGPEVIGVPVQVGGREWTMTCVSMGNPTRWSGATT